VLFHKSVFAPLFAQGLPHAKKMQTRDMHISERRAPRRTKEKKTKEKKQTHFYIAFGEETSMEQSTKVPSEPCPARTAQWLRDLVSLARHKEVLDFVETNADAIVAAAADSSSGFQEGAAFETLAAATFRRNSRNSLRHFVQHRL